MEHFIVISYLILRGGSGGQGQWTGSSPLAGLSPLGSPQAGCRGQHSCHEGEGRASAKLIAFAVLIDICRASIFSTLSNRFLPEEPLLAFVPP